jgi:hypothetical protein
LHAARRLLGQSECSTKQLKVFWFFFSKKNCFLNLSSVDTTTQQSSPEKQAASRNQVAAMHGHGPQQAFLRRADLDEIRVRIAL